MPLPPDVCQTFLPCWQKARLPHKNAFTKPAHLIACFRPRKWAAGWNGFSYRERYLPNTSLRRSRSVSSGVGHGACCVGGSSSGPQGGGCGGCGCIVSKWIGQLVVRTRAPLPRTTSCKKPRVLNPSCSSNSAQVMTGAHQQSTGSSLSSQYCVACVFKCLPRISLMASRRVNQQLRSRYGCSAAQSSALASVAIGPIASDK